MLYNSKQVVNFYESPNNEGGWHGESFSSKPLTKNFFNRPASEVARELLGKKIISSIGGKNTAGYIVETQAYTGAGDLETHKYRGSSSQTAQWKPGSLYIYSIMGQTMLTIATPPYSEGATVLIRAIEPIDGIKIMENRRGGPSQTLTSGPGNVSKALGIGTAQNGTNIFEGNGISIVSGYDVDYSQVASKKRLNCNKNPDPLLRFYISNNDWVSKPR